MSQADCWFCRWFRPLGAAILVLAILLALPRPVGAPAAVPRPTAAPGEGRATVVPTTGPSAVAPTSGAAAITPVPPAAVPSATALAPVAVVSPTAPAPVSPTAAPPAAVLPLVLSTLSPAALQWTPEGARLSGTGPAGLVLELWEGETRLGATVVGADGTWNLLVRLSEGAHNLVVRTVDAAGHAVGEAPGVTVEVPAVRRPELAERGETYVVRSGDRLIDLSRRFYGDPGQLMLIVDGTNAKAAVDPSYARITDIDQIEVNQKLWIPKK